MESLQQSAAEFGLSEDVVEVLVDMKLTTNDLQHLTRDDINSEFGNYTFAIRKEIWKFIVNQQTVVGSSSTTDFIADSPCCSTSTEPLEDSIDMNTSTDTSTSNSFTLEDYVTDENQVKSKIFSMFQSSPIGDALPCTGKYPGGIPTPFPLDQKYITALNTTRDKFCSPKNYHCFLRLIQKIYEVISAFLKRKPTKEERKVIAANLCDEYPVLKCGENHAFALQEALRKRANNVEMRASIKMNCYQKARKRKSQHQLAESSEMKEKRLKYIEMLNGEKITCHVLLQFPQYKDPEKCCEDLAYLKKVGLADLHEMARKRWQAFIEHGKKMWTLTGLNDHLILSSTLLGKIWGHPVVSKYVLTICSDGQITSNACNQPYICCMNCFDGSKQITIMSDKIPFVHLKNEQEKPYFPFLVLLATYFVLNLTYPAPANNCYSGLEWVLTGQGDNIKSDESFAPFFTAMS